MSLGINYSVNTPANYNPIAQTGGPDETQQTNTSNRNLTVTLTGAAGTHGAGGPFSITLSYPLLGPEDISLNEFLQQLEGLNPSDFAAATLAGSVLLLNDAILGMVNQIAEGGKPFIEANAGQLAEFFGQVEEQAGQFATSLYDLISNSTYPDFNDFLKEMMAVAQELRELAAEAKHAAIMGEYNNLLEQSEAMKTAAEHNYKAALKDVEAQMAQAIGKIVSGALSFAGAVGGAFAGGAGARFAGAQGGVGIGGALGSIAEGASGVIAAQHSKQSADEKHKAELAQAFIKTLEASRTLMQEAQQVAGDLSEIAKQLRDMVLKLYQDFISSQSQIIQRANI